jgi:CheY-like chemotaxis protein
MPVALAIVDRNMPGANGFQTAQGLRSVAANLPILMLSSDSKPGDDATCRELSISGNAVRPVKRADLLKLVCNALQVASGSSPASDRDRVAEPPPKYSGPESLRILIAEDSGDNRLLVQLYLKGAPHALTFVENGKDAVDQYSSSDFDLILMDLQMPIMDGLTATTCIRAIESERGSDPIPIIALSANARPQDVRMSAEAGCNAHLSKPISKQRLLAALHEHASHPEPEETTDAIEVDEGLAELVPAYLEARRQEVPRMLDLLERRDLAGIRALVHNMKGTGTSYGFPKLTKLGAAMQAAVDNMEIDSVSRLIGDLGAYLEKISVNAN